MPYVNHTRKWQQQLNFLLENSLAQNYLPFYKRKIMWNKQEKGIAQRPFKFPIGYHAQ